jgi:hypothetical protein
MTPPLDPERLARMLDDAVRPVTARPGAFDRIRQGARRRRTARRAGAVLLAATVIAGGTATALIVIPGGGPARIGSLASSATASSATGSSTAGPPGAQAGQPAGQTRTAALPSAGKQAAPTAASSAGSAPFSAAPSAPSAAQSAPSAAQSAPSAAQSAPSAAPSAQPSAAASAPSSAGPSALASVGPSAPPSTNRPAAAGIPSATISGSWAIDGFSQPAASVTIVPVGNPKTTFRFLLVVRTPRYGTQTVPFTATYGPVIVGAANAAKDGHTELFVLVDKGCCTQFWTIFRLVSGHIVQVEESGAPVRLAVGGSVMDNGGFSCSGQYLVTYGYANQASPTRVRFLATRDTYRWAGASLVLVSQRQATIRGMQNPELALYSGVSCGGLPQYEVQR